MKIKLYVNTGFANCNHKDELEVPDEEWNAMSVEEREKFLDEAALDFMGSVIDFGALPVEDGKS